MFEKQCIMCYELTDSYLFMIAKIFTSSREIVVVTLDCFLAYRQLYDSEVYALFHNAGCYHNREYLGVCSHNDKMVRGNFSIII